MVKWIILGVLALLLLGILAVVFWVEAEAPFAQEQIAEGQAGRALILYHPSRDAHFSDDVTEALARGFEEQGFAVERWTITSETPGRPLGFDSVAIVSNTFFWAPDWPTMRYVARADLTGQNVVMIICGGGSTERAERRLSEAIRRAGGDIVASRALWTSRPNEARAPAVANRLIAFEIAQRIARETAGDAAPARAAPIERGGDRLDGGGAPAIDRR